MFLKNAEEQMAARKEILADSDDAILQQLAEDQIAHLRGKIEKIPILKPKSEDDEVSIIKNDNADTLEYPPVDSAVSAKIAELISQLQEEKAVERAAEQAKQAEQAKPLVEVLSGELINAKDIKPFDARQIESEKPLDDIEETFAPQGEEIPLPTTTTNLAEEILSQRMAAESVMGEEFHEEKFSSPAPVASQANPAAELEVKKSPPVASQTNPAARLDVKKTPPVPQAVPEISSAQSKDDEDVISQLKNFLIPLLLVFLATMAGALAWYLFFA